MYCDDIRDQLEAFVLGVLDEEAQADIRLHLESCPDCRAIVADYIVLVDELPQLLVEAAPLTPPASAKARLIAKISKQTRTSLTKAFPNGRTPQRYGIVRRFALPVLSFLLVMSLLMSVYLSAALARERDYRLELAHQTELIFEVVDSERTERTFLRSAIHIENGTLPPYGKVFTRSDMPYVVAMTGRLPQPPAGQVYNLWLYRDGEAEHVGQLSVDAMGFSSLVYNAQEVGLNYERAEVVLQNDNSTSPSTGTLVLNWQAP
jgi:hypothetical protein